MLRYLAALTPGRITLWCYLIWYLVTVVAHFDPSPAIWFSSAGISLIVGIALQLSVQASGGPAADRWQRLRLFLMPFCVSSFSSLIKGQGYILVVPVRPLELGFSAGLCAAFVLLVLALKRRQHCGAA